MERRSGSRVHARTIRAGATIDDHGAAGRRRIRQQLGADWSSGVDTFKDGEGDTPVTGVAVTMMATMDVLKRAVAAGANFVITHEPTFYGHLDQLTTLEGEHDAMTAAKRAYIAEHHLVVLRLHDHWHYPARNPDPRRGRRAARDGMGELRAGARPDAGRHAPGDDNRGAATLP